ncbi:MAG: hypothetical protein COA79_25000 [Planctomycetota bacterium]|nr:MAG: hypothetical protein COA79_25000 [Planctomycetota bacterium]
MNRLQLFFLIFISLVSVTSAKDKKSKLIMHEWGTFTTEIKYGGNGKLLTGLEKEEEHLPDFVYQYNLNSLNFFSKGFSTSVTNVTVKMETPVIYFYTENETPFTVDIHFNGGKISQWYPQKTNGGKIDPKVTRIIDFKNLKENGYIQWNGTILAKDTKEKLTKPALKHQNWLMPRETDSNLIKVNDEVEKYLFYRGLGNFETPFNIHFENHKMIMTNNKTEDIPYILIYKIDSSGLNPKTLWEGSIKGNQSSTYNFKNNTKRSNFNKTNFISALKTAGLYEKEAIAMLNTWETSYFKKEGLRIFWILPKNLTNKILPLTMKPTPTELKRVLVGRINIVK